MHRSASIIAPNCVSNCAEASIDLSWFEVFGAALQRASKRWVARTLLTRLGLWLDDWLTSKIHGKQAPSCTQIVELLIFYMNALRQMEMAISHTTVGY